MTLLRNRNCQLRDESVMLYIGLAQREGSAFSSPQYLDLRSPITSPRFVLDPYLA
jgi:hypothetical protein